MTDDRKIEEKFWDALDDSPFVMLGVEGERDGATRPMTVQFEDSDRAEGRLYVFTAKDHDLVQALGQSDRAHATYAAKGHHVFASLRGTLTLDNDRAVIDRLWSPIVAEWYDGKDDPKLALLRFDVADAKVWLSDLEGFLKPAINKLFGRAPDAGAKEKVAEINY
ncbi:MAG: pyridoxamine 5'-phosphate oxidase family protein [Sphingomicrobium sp.]